MAQELRQALAMLAPAAMAKELELSLDAPDTLIQPLDVSAFRSIVHNLIGNAILYAPAGGQIAVELAVDAAVMTLTSYDEPGCVLGLTIVKQASAKRGGRVWIEDGTDGRGCKFVVALPYIA